MKDRGYKEASAEAILKELFGPRCAEYNPDCFACVGWKAIDRLTDGLLAGMPEKRIELDDDDIKDEYKGEALRHNLQENNINIGYNLAREEIMQICAHYFNPEQKGQPNESD